MVNCCMYLIGLDDCGVLSFEVYSIGRSMWVLCEKFLLIIEVKSYLNLKMMLMLMFYMFI